MKRSRAKKKRKVNVGRLLKALGVKVRHKGGGELWARCPFKGHTERTGSWSIQSDPKDPKYGWHKCFGCGRGGGPVDLVMLRMGVQYPFARNWIEERGLYDEHQVSFDVQLRVSSENPSEFRLPDEVIGIGGLGTWATDAKEEAKRRGLTVVQVQRWGIGYAKPGFGANLKVAGRIVFPMRDDQGVLKNYSARSYTGHRIKYKSGAIEDGADAGALFGPEHWPHEHERRQRVFVSEGALNALANERVGARYIAAIDGSELLPAHLAAIGTFETIVIVSDPDLAGDKMAKAFTGLSRWRKVRRVILPTGLDSNDIERADPNELRRLLGIKRSKKRSSARSTKATEETIPF